MKKLPLWALWTTLVAFVLLVIVNIVMLVLLAGKIPASQPAGGVDLTILTVPDCVECTNATVYTDEMEKLGVAFDDIKSYTTDSFAGKRLVTKYSITKAPAFVFSKELGDNQEIAAAWSRIGTVAPDGSYILEGVLPPYYDLKEQKVRGFVKLTYLIDSSCTECYDVTLHKQILEQFGMVFEKIDSIDISSAEGKALITAYNITAVPTALVQGDAGVYVSFDDIWKSVGTVEPDGTYLFRSVEIVGEPYKDLTTGKVVVPSAQ